MATAPIFFTTGPSLLPDVGELTYNGCTFSPLFSTELSGTMVKDAANRTVKYMEYSLKVDGYVTLNSQLKFPDDVDDISETVNTLRELLTEQAAPLTYLGRGFNLIVNKGDNDRDVAWGPVPEVLEFVPMGNGNSAKIVWQCKVRISEQVRKMDAFERKLKAANPDALVGRKDPFANIPMLQFNYETSVSYSEDGFSTLSIRGTIEVPLTRTPDQKSRTFTYTADNLRSQIDKRIMAGVDLAKFRPTRRNFNLSRDKRTLEWDLQFEEIPFMNMPPACTVARGSYNVRPAKTGMGLVQWLCTLRCTYTVQANMPRRLAWFAFLALLRLRMKLGNVFGADLDDPKDTKKKTVKQQVAQKLLDIGSGQAYNKWFEGLFAKQDQVDQGGRKLKDRRVFLIDLSMDEGIYLDSKTVTFSATWRLVALFQNILLASGIWTKVAEVDDQKNNIWATSISPIAGSKSWLVNTANPSLDVIVDFGGG